MLLVIYSIMFIIQCTTQHFAYYKNAPINTDRADTTLAKAKAKAEDGNNLVLDEDSRTQASP